MVFFCLKLFYFGFKGCWWVFNFVVKMIGEYCLNLEIFEVKDCRDILEVSLVRLRVCGVMIDVGRIKRLILYLGLYGYVE